MNLAARVKNLFVNPRGEWQVIEGEKHTVQDLYTGYVMILAAIPALCGFVGLSLVGVGAFGATYRMPLAQGVAYMAMNYLFSLGWVYAFAMIIEALAKGFGAQKDFHQALKVAAFSPTAMWIAGVFSIVPSLSIIGTLVGLYSLYLLFLGLPTVMKAPEDKALPYTVVVIIVAIVLEVLVAALTALAMPAPIRGFSDASGAAPLGATKSGRGPRAWRRRRP